MKILFVGSSSSLCKLLMQSFKKKDIITISTKKNNTKFHIKNYSEKNIEKLCKFFSTKKFIFDRVVFFNGFHQLSTFRYFNLKLFNKINSVNVVVPLIFISCITKYNLLKKNGSFLFFGSIASELNEIGNSYYSSAKFTLKKIILLLKKEISFNRFNILSLGLVKNEMSKELLNKLPKNEKFKKYFLANNKIIKIFKKVLKDTKSNGKIFKYYGKYKVKN